MKIGFLFPGQGSQYVGMCAGPVGEHPAGAAALAEAEAALGPAFAAVLRGGPEETLTLTSNAQPAILAVSVAWLRVLAAERPEITPAVAAGHSLGEYSALVAAGSLDFAEALALVRLRGQAMQRAVPAGEGSMAALRGVSRADAEALCADVRAALPGRVVSLAAVNSPDQIVLAGHIDALDAAVVAAGEAGARAATRLNVSAPFHCELLSPAAEELAAALADARISPPRFPVLHNIDAAPTDDPERIRQNLVDQVRRPVLWLDTVQRMLAGGVERVIEVGPGRTLGGLARKIERKLPAVSVDRTGALEKL